MEAQLKAEDIIVAIVENMRQGLEPLLYTAWAPGLYHVHLRARDFERLKGIFPAIIDEAKIALDQEIEHLNGADRPEGLWGLLSNFRKEPAKQYLKPKEDWHISFHIDDDLLDTESCRVEALLVTPAAPEFGAGQQTVRVKTLRRAGELKTDRVPEGPAGQPPEASPAPPPAPPEVAHEGPPPAGPAGRAYARLRFEDNNGPQTFVMKKSQIAIGRGGVDYWVDLKLDTKPDVSHEHLRVWYDEGTGQFFVKDLSKFGTAVNGARIQSSIEIVNGNRQDRNIWVPLPRKARIGLADVIFLDFEAAGEK